MNKSIFTYLFILFSSSLFAQTVEPTSNFNKNYQVQAGINVIGFVRQFVNFSGNNNNISTSPYSINLKVFKKLAKQDALIGIRLGSGYVNINSSAEEATSSNSNFIETLDFRVGMEFQKSITKKWIGYVGFDYIYQKGTNNSVSRFINNGGNPVQNVTSNNRTTNMDGAGLVFGMQFNFNKHIALATEATYYYSDTKTKTSNFSTNNNNNQPPSTNKNTSTNLILPNLLNFTILF
jgi:hypothetical protein